MTRLRKKNTRSNNAMRIAKQIGKLLSIIAIIYVVRKLFKMDIPVEQLASVKSISLLILLIFCHTVRLIVMGCIPWRCFVQAFSHKKISYKQTIAVYIKSNILKYVPGNVFQFIGRNELALESEISHISVATATIFDIGTNVAVAMLLVIAMTGNVALDYLEQNSKIFLFIIAIVFVALILFLFLASKFDWAKRMSLNIKTMTKQDLLLMGGAVACYFLSHILGSIQFILVCIFMLDVSMDSYEIFYLMGVYILSYIAGYITPGASGGMGVRESVMIFFAGDFISDGITALAMVIIRIIGIAGDVLAYLVIRIMEWRKK